MRLKSLLIPLLFASADASSVFQRFIDWFAIFFNGYPKTHDTNHRDAASNYHLPHISNDLRAQYMPKYHFKSHENENVQTTATQSSKIPFYVQTDYPTGSHMNQLGHDTFKTPGTSTGYQNKYHGQDSHQGTHSNVLFPVNHVRFHQMHQIAPHLKKSKFQHLQHPAINFGDSNTVLGPTKNSPEVHGLNNMHKYTILQNAVPNTSEKYYYPHIAHFKAPHPSAIKGYQPPISVPKQPGKIRFLLLEVEYIH